MGEPRLLHGITTQCMDTTENWNTINPIIPYGVLAIEDTADNKKRIKIGDGVNTWDDLPYFPDDSALLLPATETTYGFVQKITIVEMLAGIENNKYVTALTHTTYHLQDGHRTVPSTNADTDKKILRSGNTPASEYWSVLTADDVNAATKEHTHSLESLGAAPSSHIGAIGSSAHGDATNTTSGFIASTEKNKLAGIEPGANNYIHPVTHPAVMIAEDTTHRFVTDSQINSWNTKQDALGFIPENPTNKNIANGYAGLDSNGKLADSVIPSVALVDTYTANSDTTMIALSAAQRGDICIRTDVSQTYILTADPYSILSNWIPLLTPTDTVQSVNSKTGVVIITSADIGLGNVDNTSDLNKPISTATQTALNGKAPLSHIGSSGVTQHGVATITTAGFMDSSDKSKLNGIEAGAQVNTVTSVAGKGGIVTLAKADVGLDQVDNTSDLNKPISTAVQNALNGKVATTTTVNGKSLSSSITLTTADITDSTDKRYVTDIQKTVLGNTTGTNTGDETTTSLGTKINNANTITTPVDADIVPVGDSTNSFIIRKLSWANIKATLKTYFDTLYNYYTHPATHPATMITTDATHEFVTDSQITTWNNKQNALGYTAENTANKNIANGYAGLDANGKLADSVIPNLAITNTFTATSDSTMIALSAAQRGDICIRTDVSQTYILTADPYSTLANWTMLSTPTSGVSSVNGKSGVVTLTKADVGLDQVDNTSDLNKPISTATQTALNGKVSTSRTINGQALTTDVTLTTVNIADSLNKRYVTDANLTVLGNTSGTNSGNETTSSISTIINSASTKTTVVDADVFTILDSTSSYILKKLTWASLWTQLKSLADTLYNYYVHPTSPISPGTYQAVTVDTYGHVTAGSNPSTLSGYGITDAAAINHTHSVFDGLLQNVDEKVQSLGSVSGSITINAANGNVVDLTVTAALTIALAGATSGKSRTIMLHITNGGAFVVTWPASITWMMGVAPSLKSSGKSIIILNTINGGNTWYGVAW